MFYVKDFISKNITKVYNEEELSTAVYNSIKYYRERAEELQRRNEELHDDALKIVNKELTDKIAALQHKLSMSYGEFASQKEKDAYNDFEQRHMHQRLTMKIQGGKAPYLIPTNVGIGTELKVVCPICGESEDITDTEVW